MTRKIVKSLARLKLEIVAFTVGLVILAFELAAARIVAPYLGTTIYTWTSIIGVILAALAIGYAVGGIVADKRQRAEDIAVLLIVSALLIGLVNLSKDSLLDYIGGSNLPLQIQALIASLLLFALPTLLLGAASPYLARMSITDLSTSGRSIARISAAGTAGCLVGTFLTGYLLFGLIGTSSLLTFLALLLLTTSLIFAYKNQVFLVLTALVVMMVLGANASKPKFVGLVEDVDSSYGRILVRDIDYENKQVRILQTDNQGVQSGVFLDGSPKLAFAYTRAFDYTSGLKPDAKNFLIIGGGAFTFPQYLSNKYPNASVDTVEIDNKLSQISKQYFNHKPPANLATYYADGRQYLNNSTRDYDMIYLDAYSAPVPPFQLLTRQAVARMDDSLNSQGIVVANIVSASEGNKSLLIQAAVSTFSTEFNHVAVYRVKPELNPLDRQNLLLLASKEEIDTDSLQKLSAVHPEFKGMLSNQVNFSANSRNILTDNYAPVELLALWN